MRTPGTRNLLLIAVTLAMLAGARAVPASAAPLAAPPAPIMGFTAD